MGLSEGSGEPGRERPLSTPRPGPRNALVDVPGLRCGHHTRVGDGYLTGTTVVTGPPAGLIAGIDVRGGGPGTHETDLLAPTAAAERISAIVLSGGSAFGTVTCLGVMHELADRGIGVPVGPAGVVPLVPGAVLFDLGRGGDPRCRPTAEFGRAALLDALGESDPSAVDDAAVTGSRRGAGTGATAGGFKGGVAEASLLLPADGPEDTGTVTVAAVAAVNAFGSPVDPRTGGLWGARHLLAADLSADLAATADTVGGWAGPEDLLRPSSPAAVAALREMVSTVVRGRPPFAAFASGGAGPGRHTTLVVVATDATLTKAQCAKLASVAHGGMARALNPVHTLFDGDVVFGVSTGDGPTPDLARFNEILAAGADVVTRAITRAILDAVATTTPAGIWPAWRDLALRPAT